MSDNPSASPGAGQNARDVLCRIIAEYGPPVAIEVKRLKGLLDDLCGSRTGENTLLLNAARHGVPVKLMSPAAAAQPAELLLSRLTLHLEEHLLVSHSVARWAVESWALALGRITPEDLTTTDLNVNQVQAPAKEEQHDDSIALIQEDHADSASQTTAPDDSATSEHLTNPPADTTLPAEIARLRWNWGAFFLNYVWLFAHKKKGLAIGYLLMTFAIDVLCTRWSIPNGVINDFMINKLHYNFVGDFDLIGNYIYAFIEYLIIWVLCIPLALKANEMAWRTGQFHDVEQFQKAQRKWSLWSPLGVVLGVVVLELWALFWWKAFRIYL